jgi:hypothetical protein
MNNTVSKFCPCYINWVTCLCLQIDSGMVLFLKGVAMSDHCSWCHYLSCVPIGAVNQTTLEFEDDW